MKYNPCKAGNHNKCPQYHAAVPCSCECHNA